MQFTSLIFAGLATAAVIPVDSVVDIVNPAHGTTAPDPATYENTGISGFSVHETLVGFTQAVQSVDSVTFTVNNNVTCTAENPDLIGKVYSCGDSAYRFGLLNGTTTDFALRIYKQTGAFAGWTGLGDVDTVCRAGPTTATSGTQICEQQVDSTIVITA
ncbi:hypothetical protein N0V82_008534 [Gnomoniopsis sp. IMI 355080]|nr:hypothetical protein N0V82_008534 [Gnomoniopsis sp. IMI 355080]